MSILYGIHIKRGDKRTTIYRSTRPECLKYMEEKYPDWEIESEEDNSPKDAITAAYLKIAQQASQLKELQDENTILAGRVKLLDRTLQEKHQEAQKIWEEDKEYILAAMTQRISDEYRKHKNNTIDWARIAAQKIYGTFSISRKQ